MAAAALTRGSKAVTKGIVITVPDLYGGRWPLQPLEMYLRYGSDLSIENYRYRPRTQTLQEAGEGLAELMRLQKPHTSVEGIDFVTHGYGALVLREAFLHLEWNDIKSKVVMLAPPNRGLRYFRSMKSLVGVAGYGGTAAEELAHLEALALDTRLGKLPARCYPLVIAGKLCLNPFNQAQYPNDGLVKVEETTLPQEHRHEVMAATHYSLPLHPRAMVLTHSFLNA